MPGAGVGGGAVCSDRLVDPLQPDAAKQPDQWSATIRALADEQGGVGTSGAAAAAALTDSTGANGALNVDLPGLLGASGLIGGGPQQGADGYGHQSASPTDPLSAANPVPPVDRTTGDSSPDTGNFHSPLVQAPLSLQMTAALEAAGYSRSGTRQGGDVSTNAQSQPGSRPSVPAAAVPGPTGSSGQATLPSGSTTTLGGAPGSTAETSAVPWTASTGGAPPMEDTAVPSAAAASVSTLVDRQAVAAPSLPFVAPRTDRGPASWPGGGGAGARAGVADDEDSVTPVAAIPGSLTPGRPVPAQTAPASTSLAAEGSSGVSPRCTPPECTVGLPGLSGTVTAGLTRPISVQQATLAGLPSGAWASGFRPAPVATAEALLTPGIAVSSRATARRAVEHGMVAYAERRPILLDLAPFEAEASSWRLDDTQTLVSIAADGTAAARARAVALYRALMEQGEGLGALRSGEGFVTWGGSPLWLSLAGIAKPGQQGVLPNGAVPGSVQVQRIATGEWLVEHAGGASAARPPLRHEAASVDDESLCADVLYGVTASLPDSARLRHFEHALSALRFASELAPPARWRSAEAWASVARLCAASAMQVGGALTRPTEAALQAALSVVVTGLAPSPPKDALSVPPLSRNRFLGLALSGNPERIVAALKGLGRAVLDRVRRGVVDDLDALDSLALAVCLGRLAHTSPQPTSNAAASSRPGAGAIARSVNSGRLW
jgi:hypothetical protein